MLMRDMDGLFERLEAMGPTGGVISVGLALALTAAGIGVLAVAAMGPSDATVVYRFVEEATGQPGQVHMSSELLLISGLMMVVFAIAPAMIGARAMRGSAYPSAAEVFPPMAVTDIEAALAKADEPLCVCTNCRVMVPAAFSTGGCPVCASSVEYHEVHSEEDARMVIAAMS